MPDKYQAHYSAGMGPIDAPVTRFLAVTPNDSTDLAFVSRAIMVGADGNVSLIGLHDTAPVTVAALKAGTIYPFRCSRIRATGTTATGIVAMD